MCSLTVSLGHLNYINKYQHHRFTSGNKQPMLSEKKVQCCTFCTMLNLFCFFSGSEATTRRKYLFMDGYTNINTPPTRQQNNKHMILRNNINQGI